MMPNFRVLILAVLAMFGLISCDSDLIVLAPGQGRNFDGGTSQMLYRNGNYGSWFGDPILASASSGAGLTPASVSDNIYGDGQALEIYYVGTSTGEVYLTTASVHSASDYYANGSIRFDIRLAFPPALYNLIQFNYKDFTNGSNPSGGAIDASSHVIDPATLSEAQFTAVAIPVNSMPNYTSTINGPFTLQIVMYGTKGNLTYPGSGIVAYIDDVRWVHP